MDFRLPSLLLFLPGGWKRLPGGTMARILLVGYIAELLQERERALRAAGYAVIMASTFSSASAAIQRHKFDLALLTFSVPEADRNLLARALKEADPHTKIIMTYYASVKNTELADALMQNTASAEDILRAVNHLLNVRNREQAG
jgi:DNA-binding NtrC family response regulator